MPLFPTAQTITERVSKYSYIVEFEKPLTEADTALISGELVKQSDATDILVSSRRASFVSSLPVDQIEPILRQLAVKYDNHIELRASAKVG